MKIIFLDIDGVLNCDNTRNPRKFPYVVDPRLLARLKRLLKATRATVVLSSSWRCDPVGLLAARHWGIPFFDVCPDKPRSPRKEMLAWLRQHPEVTRFAIIDDEDDGLDEFPLFQPSPKTGLTPEIAKGVQKYLKARRIRRCVPARSSGSARTFTRSLKEIKVEGAQRTFTQPKRHLF
jgi:hypothetical protein